MIADFELKGLKKELKRSKRAAFAEGTDRNLHWQWQTFFLFCTRFQYKPVPASSETICLYAQFLSRSFKAVESIRNYISGVRTLHHLLEVEFPSADNIDLKLALRGLARLNPHCPKQAEPLSPEILVQIWGLVDEKNVYHVVMWALTLVAFFTLSRKSNLVVTDKQFDSRKQLCRGDISLGTNGLLVTYRWTKTNQFGKVLEIPVLAIKGSVLCPWQAYLHMLDMVPAGKCDPAFCFPSKQGVTPVTYNELQNWIKGSVKKLGYNE